MKKLAIHFSDPEPMGYPFNSTSDAYWEIYQGIIKDIEKHGIGVYIVRGQSYLGKGVFSHGWQIKNGTLLYIDQLIKVDLIFYRGNKSTIPATYDWPMINHPDLDRLCDDKVKTAEFFPEFSPKTKAIDSYRKFVETISEWGFNPEDKIVLKKNFLSEGRDVNILPIREVVESLYDSWDTVLIQEFIDSSVGIPGIVEGLHDIRVNTIDGESVHTFVRIPAPGSFIANLARGGTIVPLAIEQLPSSLLEVVATINKKLVQYRPSIFASDFVNSKNGFKLVELNSRPGVSNPRRSLQHKKFNDKIVELLVQALS